MKYILLHIRQLLLKTPYVLGVFVFFAACENDIQEVRELTAKQDSAIVSAINVEINYSTNGNKSVLMKAPVLNRYSTGEENAYL